MRDLEDRPIPCGDAHARGAVRYCDAYGVQLGLATLPGTGNTECHDDVGRELFDILMEARLHVELQPAYIFNTLFLPAFSLAAAPSLSGEPERLRAVATIAAAGGSS